MVLRVTLWKHAILHQGFNWKTYASTEENYNLEAECYMERPGNHVGKLLTVSKKTIFSSKIAECVCSQKDLFRITKNLMGHKREIILPNYSSDNVLANKFGDFFTKKTAPSTSDTIVMSADDKFEHILNLPLRMKYVLS